MLFVFYLLVGGYGGNGRRRQASGQEKQRPARGGPDAVVGIELKRGYSSPSFDFISAVRSVLSVVLI